MVMAHPARLSALPRSGRMSLPLLLSVMSLCALVGLAGWQVWIRFANPPPSENTVLPDEQGSAQIEPSQPDSPAADETSDDGAFLRDNFEEKIATTTALVGLGAQGAEAAPA